jgi:hypothetical protein
MRIFLLWVFLPLSLLSQPKIDVAGDNWAGRVQMSLDTIQKYDEASHNVINKSVDRISFWMGDFSSNVKTKEGERTILISVNDMGSKSLNNICAILIHESVHLWAEENNVGLNPHDEEILCYSLELELLKRIPDVEPWLLEHAETQIKNHQKNK